MNDKKLLELAAKAAGVEVIFPIMKDESILGAMLTPTLVNTVPTWWNPLTDDGDALKLAVKLNIAISFPMGNGKFSSVTAGQVGSSKVGCHEPFNPDPCAATRRAIVRAAAELGG